MHSNELSINVPLNKPINISLHSYIKNLFVNKKIDS